MLLTLTSTAFCAQAHDDVSKEYQLKAAYLLNFARFIYWPEEAFKTAEKKFNICVLGGSPFGGSLDKLSSKKIQNKKIKLRYEKTIDEVKSCHIVYFGETEKEEYESVISDLSGSVTLTVSDINGFSENGGMIEFIRVKNKIKFEINIEQSSRSGIKYRSQLLEVAEKLR